MAAHVMRPIKDTHMSIKVELMVWSTKMDLIALSYANGEVALHRLNWLKVWVLQRPNENLTVKGLAWRPDGKVLAVGYSNRDILLVDVEQRDIIHKYSVRGDITSMTWSDERIDDKCHTPVQFAEPYKVFLPALPCFTRGSCGDHEYKLDAKGLEEGKNLNLLFIGLSTGELLISVFGLYPRVPVDVKTMLNLDECTILDAGVSKDQDLLLVTVKSKNSVWIATFESTLFSNHDNDLMTMAYRYGHISCCLEYMDLALEHIIEGWEDIMMEMDCKLRAYAAKVPPGRVSCDFLELLMFGIPTEEMSLFLLHDLKEKGLKTLTSSIENSYLNIQGLVLKHLQAMGQSLSFQLDELCGLARCPTFYQVLGLFETDVMTAFAATGSFMVKVTEVQHVCDESLKKNKAFFNWLYAIILRLNEERLPEDVSSMTPTELQRVVDFLSGLEYNGRFNLEQLGQYLTDAPLSSPPPPAEMWDQFLKRHPSLASLPEIVQHNTQLSLVQEARKLREQVNAVFERSESVLKRYFKLTLTTKIAMVEGARAEVLPKVTHSYIADQNKFMVATLDQLKPLGYHFVELWMKNGPACDSFIDVPQPVVDIQFYLPDVLSLLLDMSPNSNAGFAQVPYPQVGEPFSTRIIEGMVPATFAVCGARKVAVVLSESRRKVKIFEMDVEEDDDEEGMDTTNSSIIRDTELDLSGGKT